jgi:hypothetical protein
MPNENYGVHATGLVNGTNTDVNSMYPAAVPIPPEILYTKENFSKEFLGGLDLEKVQEILKREFPEEFI